jgi:D-alanyl-D-alanine carboxypeptidase
MKRFSICILSLFLWVQFSHGQTFNHTLSVKLQNKLDSLKTAYNIKGISASVFCPGQGLWQGVSGQSYRGVPITKEMEFGIGSNTKLFTAVAILKLAENNLLNIDDHLYKWLPTIINIDSNITIKQILNHTSGIADFTNHPGYPYSVLSNSNRVFNPFELLAWVGKPLFPAGTNTIYSNTNYILAGLIFEKASGQNIAKFIRDSILTPLNLDSTFFDVQESVLGAIAHPWQNGTDINNIPRISLNSAAWTAGAIYSTSGEMAQWYKALMNGQVLNDNSFKLMTTFTGPGNYGLGIGKQIINGRIVWGYGGNIRGYRSRMVYDTTLKVILCILTNSNPLEINDVAIDLLLTIVNNPVTEKNESLVSQNQTFIYPDPASGTVHFKIH